jgi:hypothetical protein
MMNGPRHSLKENKCYSTQYAYELAQSIEKIHEFARAKLPIFGQTMKKYYDHTSQFFWVLSTNADSMSLMVLIFLSTMPSD